MLTSDTLSQSWYHLQKTKIGVVNEEPVQRLDLWPQFEVDICHSRLNPHYNRDEVFKLPIPK